MVLIMHNSVGQCGVHAVVNGDAGGRLTVIFRAENIFSRDMNRSDVMACPLKAYVSYGVNMMVNTMDVSSAVIVYADRLNIIRRESWVEAPVVEFHVVSMNSSETNGLCSSGFASHNRSVTPTICVHDVSIEAYLTMNAATLLWNAQWTTVLSAGG